jgi:maltooligosyltrehalose trehalohydrolase
VLAGEAFVLRFFGAGEAGDRLLLVNLGRHLELKPAPEPLLAPPAGHAWRTLWSSDDPRYGGCGSAPAERADGWHIPAHAAVVLAPVPRTDDESEA